MNRLRLNDMMMGAYMDTLARYGYQASAEACARIYETQRAEIIKEEGDDNV